jgi:cytidylate kinase
MSYSIAIDGPAGAGKSTIAKRIAKQLGFIYVDTGAMYRAMALHILRKGIVAEDSAAISKACEDADITIRYENGEQVVYLNDENVNGMIRTEKVGNMASASSVNGDVRKKLVSLQQKLAKTTDVIMDGRDIGTCVLPDADVKVYLTAGSKVRAKRRYDELTAKGVVCDFGQIEKDIIERDERDMNREISPLKQAEDAVLLDSSELSIDEVVARIIAMTEAAPKKA